MKLKIFLLIFGVSIFACADRIGDIKHAKRYGANARIVLRCVDQDGNATTNANVSSALYPDGSFENAIVKNGTTDTNGCFVMEGKTNGEFSFTVKKKGYYETSEDKYLFKDSAVSVFDGRWQPYGATNNVVLKRIVNPIPMYCKTATVVLPEKGKAFGFDCIKGDLVEPFGKGVEADFFFNYSLEYSRDNVWNATNYLNITFTTNSGATWLHSDMFSEMKTLYEAPGRGYTNTICFYLRSKDRSNREERKFQPDEYLVFKSRTVVDRNGVETNSVFGKIIPAQFWYGEENKEGIGGQVVFSYYINPTQNDHNIEFDRKNNLFKPEWRDYSWPQEP